MTLGSMILGTMAVGTADGMIRGSTIPGTMVDGTADIPGTIMAGDMSTTGATSDSAEATGFTGPGLPPLHQRTEAASVPFREAQAPGVLP